MATKVKLEISLELSVIDGLIPCFETFRCEVPFEAVLMCVDDRLSYLNQAKVTAKPQDDYLKQKSNKKSGNWQKVMIFPVENKTKRLLGE